MLGVVGTNLFEPIFAEVCRALRDFHWSCSKVAGSPVGKSATTRGSSIGSCRVSFSGFCFFVDSLNFVLGCGSLSASQLLVILLVKRIEFARTCTAGSSHLLTHHLLEGTALLVWHIECALGALFFFSLGCLLHIRDFGSLECASGVWLPLNIVQDFECLGWVREPLAAAIKDTDLVVNFNSGVNDTCHQMFTVRRILDVNCTI